jgi:hypothetical protein
MRTLKDKLNHLNPQRREKVEVRAAQTDRRGDDQTGVATSPQAHTATPRESPRLYPGWGFPSGKNAPTSCSLRCVNTLRQWEDNLPSSLNFATVSASFSAELLRKRSRERPQETESGRRKGLVVKREKFA